MMITTASAPMWMLEHSAVWHKSQLVPNVQGGFHHFFGNIAYQPKFCYRKICLRLTQNASHFGQG